MEKTSWIIPLISSAGSGIAALGSRIAGSRAAAMVASRLSAIRGANAASKSGKFMNTMRWVKNSPKKLQGAYANDARNIQSAVKNPGKYFGGMKTRFDNSSKWGKAGMGLTAGFAGAEVASGNPVKGMGYLVAPNLAITSDLVGMAKDLTKK